MHVLQGKKPDAYRPDFVELLFSQYEAFVEVLRGPFANNPDLVREHKASMENLLRKMLPGNLLLIECLCVYADRALQGRSKTGSLTESEVSTTVDRVNQLFPLVLDKDLYRSIYHDLMVWWLPAAKGVLSADIVL